MVIVVGREGSFWYLGSRNSVLSSFSWSLFCNIQCFKSSMQATLQLTTSSACDRSPDFWSWLSSAKLSCKREWRSMTTDTGVTYKTNKTGPNTEPWGTPQSRGVGEEYRPLTEVVWVRADRYDWIQCKAVPEIPKELWSLERRMLWSMVSKAADKSRRERREICFHQEREGDR